MRKGLSLGEVAGDGAGLEGGDSGEGAGVAAQIEVGVGEQEFVGIERRHDAGGDEAGLVTVGQGTEENAIDGAEDGGSGSDGDGGCEQGGEGEGGVAAESSKCVAEVLKGVLDPGWHSLLDTGRGRLVPRRPIRASVRLGDKRSTWISMLQFSYPVAGRLDELGAAGFLAG